MIMSENNFREPYPPTPFSFICDGTFYPVRPEPRGNKIYWYMRKQINGKTWPVYLGGVGQLSSQILRNAAEQIEYRR